MNILFLDQFSDLGGAQQCLLDLLPAIQQQGWNAHVAAPGDGPLVARVKALGFTADRVPSGPFSSGKKSAGDVLRFAFEWPRLTGRIRELADRYQIELLYVNGPRLLPAAAQSQMPIIFHCHNYLASGSPEWLVGRALRKSRATVIASCDFVAKPLRKYMAAERVHTVYNGVKEALNNGRARHDRTVGVVGRIAPEKGQAEFIQAVKILIERRIDCRFQICGGPLFGDREASAYYERVRALATGLPVEFVTWQSDIGGVLRGLDLLVVPSVAPEATPRVILEAYSASVPVVAFRSGGIPEIVQNDQTGFLIDEPSPRALADKIEALLQSPERLRQAAEAGRQLWQRQFMLDRCQREIVNLCNTVQMSAVADTAR